MRNLLVAIALLAVTGVSTMAQTPKVELFTGLSYGQFNPGGLLTDSESGVGRHFSMPGLEATGEYNFTSHLGFVADVSGYGGTGDVDSLADHLRVYNYLFGPQLTQRHIGPFSVFVRALAGTSRCGLFKSITCATTLPTARQTRRLALRIPGARTISASPRALIGNFS